MTVAPAPRQWLPLAARSDRVDPMCGTMQDSLPSSRAGVPMCLPCSRTVLETVLQLADAPLCGQMISEKHGLPTGTHMTKISL